MTIRVEDMRDRTTRVDDEERPHLPPVNRTEIVSLPRLPRIYRSDEPVTYYRGRLKLGDRVIATRSGASLESES